MWNLQCTNLLVCFATNGTSFGQNDDSCHNYYSKWDLYNILARTISKILIYLISICFLSHFETSLVMIEQRMIIIVTGQAYIKQVCTQYDGKLEIFNN